MILKFWKIVNVHGPYDDLKFRDHLRSATRSVQYENLKMLEEFAEIVEKIHANTEKHVTSFNKRYSRGLTHTCRGLVDWAKHLISKKVIVWRVIYLWFFGKQFGKLRQGFGGTYFITVQQISEKVGIAKTLDVKIDGFSIHSCEKCGYLLDEDKCKILDSLPDLEKKLPSDVMMTLICIYVYFYINIYTLNKKIYNHQAYIYMLRYTWEQKNIHIKYKKNTT